MDARFESKMAAYYHDLYLDAKLKPMMGYYLVLNLVAKLEPKTG